MDNLTNLIIIQKQVAELLNVEISDSSCWKSEENDIHIHGTIFVKKKPGKGEKLVVKADLLDAEGRVLYNLKDYSAENLRSAFDSFSMYCSSVNRFFDVHAIAAIRLYPVLYAK